MSDNREFDCIGALHLYFEELHNLNRNVITLSGFNAYDNADDYEIIAQKVICAIPRLVPYEYNKAQKQYVIESKDGLMEYADMLPFLESGFNSILNHFDNDHSSFLRSVKKIRNKLEHRMQGILQVGVSSGTDGFCLHYADSSRFYGDSNQHHADSSDGTYDLSSDEMIAFTKELNELYAQIQDWVKGTTTFREKSDYSYLRRITRYSFRHFNEIFDSKIASIIGTGMGEF